MKASSRRQMEHYETIHDDYGQHYYDPTSMAYRGRFVYDALFEGLDLNGKLVADLASGDGANSLAVLERFPGAETIGFDISTKACDAYRRTTGRPAHALDLMAGADPGVTVDVAMIFGGLHHCVGNLPMTFKTIGSMLNPGGILLMYEPNRRFVLEGLRRIWYRLDKYFDAETEAALSHDELARDYASEFSPIRCRHMGGPAYFLVFNSLVFRIPLGWKRVIAPPLFGAERAYNRLPGRIWYPYFIAQWRYRGASATRATEMSPEARSLLVQR